MTTIVLVSLAVIAGVFLALVLAAYVSVALAHRDANRSAER